MAKVKVAVSLDPKGGFPTGEHRPRRQRQDTVGSRSRSRGRDREREAAVCDGLVPVAEPQWLHREQGVSPDGRAAWNSKRCRHMEPKV